MELCIYIYLYLYQIDSEGHCDESFSHFILLRRVGGCLLLSLHLDKDVSDELFEVAIHLCERFKTIDALGFLFWFLVCLGDSRVEWDLALTNSLDVLKALAVDRLFVLLALPCHLGQVSLARWLCISAFHFAWSSETNGLFFLVGASDSSPLNAALDLRRGEELSLVKDLFGLLLELYA